jgi:hypothetical protein
MSSSPNDTQQPHYQPPFQQPPQPGYSAPYAQTQPYPPQPSYGEGYTGGGAPAGPQWYNEKNEEYGTVMQPKKKKFNDVIFLILFILTVRPLLRSVAQSMRSWVPGRRLRGCQWTRIVDVYTTRRSE